MWKVLRIVWALIGALALASQADAQAPGKKDAEDSAKVKAKDYSNAPIVTQMMAFNKKKDCKLTKDEVTDTRLHRLFDQADANKDGVVTKEELIALAAKLDAEAGQEPGGGRGGPGGRGPTGPGGPGGRGFGGPGGPPQPGQIMPPFVQEMLKLTADQKKQFEELQKDVDAKLAKILTDDQKKQLKQMSEGFGRRGPAGRGGPGGRGPGGRGGPDSGGGPPER